MMLVLFEPLARSQSRCGSRSQGRGLLDSEPPRRGRIERGSADPHNEGTRVALLLW